MNNNADKQGMQRRVLVATLIAFVFFIAYDYFIMKPKQEAQAELVKQQQSQQVNPNNTTVNNTSATNSAPNVASSNSISAPTTKDLASGDVLTTITTKTNKIEIDRLGRISQVTLLDKQYVNEDNFHIKLFEPNQLRPLEIRFADRNVNAKAFKVNYTASTNTVDATANKQTLVLTQKIDNVVLTKTLDFYPDGHYDVKVNVTDGKQFFITPGFRPNVLADMYADHGAMLKLNDGTLTIVEDGDLDKTESFMGVKFVSAFDRYYATVLYNFGTSMQISLMPDNNGDPQAFIHGNDGINLNGYVGPKEFNSLKALNPELTDVIEYGWFTFIAKPMFVLLQYIHNIVGNWGWTIVIVTVLIKLILYPLSYKGMVSMQKLKDLAPKIKDIQAKYKNDKQKQSMHMMELYKKHGANPMGGCLPILLQIPVFFAIYRVLLNAIELKGSEWILWINDLAEMDPYFVLPILMGITMFIQQRITPTTIQDEMQRKIFMYLPVIFTFFFLWFPAGLTLYWFVNNVFTVAQQYYINRIFDKQRQAKK